MWTLLKKYNVFILAALFVLGLISINFQHSQEQPRENTLIIGLQSGYPPFEFKDSEGKIIGFDPDMAKHIADKLGKEVVIKDMEFDGIILSLKQGKIDLIMSGMNITPSRLQEILMIPYHGEHATSLSLIFWKEIPKEVLSLQDISKLPNPHVSVESGGIAEAYLSHHPAIITKSFDGALNALLDVKYGKSIANLVEPDVAEYLQKKHPEIKVLSVPLSKDDNILGFGIGIKKGNEQLLQQVQQIIQELKDSGSLKQLEDKWFKGVE